ncbi:zinc finger MYM-type 1-like protein [Labeo rohita]|uniref:Zinc finger MYM-type 1-like protein n=1 Tax=Labeo rohita TaxID=84645 RepID=A0A498L594_LABRO|nr:zinc finger MYM-type 1-like protein [Labeo rohita]RXN13619.1 zinc finger MYM-type 1-like protein [Labeo rohita]
MISTPVSMSQFHLRITPNVDMLFNQRQKRNIDPVYIKAAVQGFTNNLLAISVKFPESALKTTVEANPMLKKAKLKTELSLIYENPEFRVGSGAVPLYQFFIDNNLQSAFTDTVSLLKIIITICDNREVLFYFEGDQNYPKN